MIEKFSDYEGTQFLDREGEFVFEITDAELKESKKGEPMVVFTCKSEAGQTVIYKSLSPKARWSYNQFITAVLNLTAEDKANLELDYMTFHNNLIGKKFLGIVEEECYEKEVKVPREDGTFETSYEDAVSYKIQKFLPAK